MIKKPKTPLRTRVQPIPLVGFGLLPDDWNNINFGSSVITVDDAPVPGAIWVSQLLKDHDFTFLDVTGWLAASADSPNWEHAGYAGLDIKGDVYILAKNIDL